MNRALGRAAEEFWERMLDHGPRKVENPIEDSEPIFCPYCGAEIDRSMEFIDPFLIRPAFYCKECHWHGLEEILERIPIREEANNGKVCPSCGGELCILFDTYDEKPRDELRCWYECIECGEEFVNIHKLVFKKPHKDE